MPFQNKTPSLSLYVTSEQLTGSFYRYYRIKRNITLSSMSNQLKMNKGFLSELENGKRHFPEGLTNQLDSVLNIHFYTDYDLWKQARDYLFQIYDNYFLENDSKNILLLNEISQNKEKLNHSYGFLIMKIIELYYYLNIEPNNSMFLKLKAILDDYIHRLQYDELAIYYSLLGIYFNRSTSNNKSAKDYFLKSNKLCDSSSNVSMMNEFQLISLYARSNQSIIAFKKSNECKTHLQNYNNYNRSITLDISRCNILSNLGIYEEAKSQLIKILNTVDSEFLKKHIMHIYHSLAWNTLLSGNYEKCIEYSTLAKNNEDHTIDLCFFIPYSYFKQRKTNEFFISCQEALKDCNDIYKHFILALQAFYKKEYTEFEIQALDFYKLTLINNLYEDMLLIQKLLHQFYEDQKNSEMLIKILKDRVSYADQTLDLKTTAFKF